MRSERLDVRATPAAANLRCTSCSDSVRMAVQKAALNTIREYEVLALSQESRRIFVEALPNPPKPSQKAVAAAKRCKNEIAS